MMSYVTHPDSDSTPRAKGFLSSLGMEQSILFLAAGLIGLTFLLLTVLGQREPAKPTVPDATAPADVSGDIVPVDIAGSGPTSATPATTDE